MAAPSRVPSAVALATFCKEKYEREIGAKLPDNLATDLEAQAEHFAANDQLVQTFIRRLIPREPLRLDPNAGHFLAVVFFIIYSDASDKTDLVMAMLGVCFWRYAHHRHCEIKFRCAKIGLLLECLRKRVPAMASTFPGTARAFNARLGRPRILLHSWPLRKGTSIGTHRVRALRRLRPASR
jgi:hypothetical protein